MPSKKQPTIDDVASDNIINANEQNATITGTCEAGATISLDLGGNTCVATVTDTTWSYTLTAADITAMGGPDIKQVRIEATQTDINNKTSKDRLFIDIDTIVPGLPTIDVVAGDDIISVSEQATTIITGTCEAGATVVLFIGGNTRPAMMGNGQNNTTWSYTLTAADIIAMGQGVETISATQTDAAGNISNLATHDIIIATAPTINTVAIDDIINASEQTSTITGTCETGASVALSIDGTSRAATVVDTTWSYTLTAADITAMGQGAETISATQSLGGNTSVAVTHDIIIDTLRPTATIVVADTEIKAGETSGVTITFSEAGTDFTNTDLTIEGGSLTDVASADGGLTWTASFTPTADITDSTNLITLDNAGIMDLAGNAGVGATESNNYAIDTLRPTATIVVADTELKAGETSGVTITFSEAVTDFSNTDLTIEGGSLTDVASADGGLTWTATFTPTADITDSTNFITLDNAGVMDLAGNAGVGATESNNYAIDTLRPTVSGVAITSNAGADNTYSLGDVISVTASYSEAVVVSGNPTVTLNVGGTNRTAIYVSGSGSAALVFNHTVQAGDTDSNGISIAANSLGLNGGAVNDAAGNIATLSHSAVADNANHMVSTIAASASVTNITSATPNGSYAFGSAIDITVTFDQTVNVSGDPTLKLETGSNDRLAHYLGGNGTNTLTFRYVVSAGDTSADLDYFSAAALSGNIVGASNGVAANLTLFTPGAAGSLGANKALVINTSAGTKVELGAIAAGMGGFVINGQATGDASGMSVSSAGDVNGDGLADLIVGAPYANGFSGYSCVVFGKTDSTAVDLSAIAAGTGGFVINGQAAGDMSGISVSSAGDVNGDGLADLIVGAQRSAPAGGIGAGRSYVVFGKTNTSTIDLSAIASGTGGFVINGQATGDTSGASVSSAGDVNGDGLADLIVGAYFSDPAAGTNAGRSYVVFGKDSTTAINLSAVAAGTGGFVINGQAAGDSSGYSVSSAGDVNGDGLADLLVGAPYFDHPAAGPLGGRGRSYVVFGKTSNTAINLSAVASGTGGFVINGEAASPRIGKPGDISGFSVSSAGDVNGDGLADLIVGAICANPAAGEWAGRSYVVFGKTSTTAINLSTITAGTGGFVINGQAARDQSGYSVSSAGDVNGDGLADLIVGAICADPAGGLDAGRSYVVFGKNNTTAVNLSAIAAGTGGFVINGQAANNWSGASVSAAGDVNGDGLADLIVGAPFSDPVGGLDAGRSYVIFGGQQFATTIDFLGDTSANILTGTAVAETFVAGDGDDTITGGGGADVMMGGMGNDVFALNISNITALASNYGIGGNNTQLSMIDGGTGFDTISLTEGANLNLTAISNIGASGIEENSRIESIEKIDLSSDATANILTLTAKDVLDMAGMNLIHTGLSADDKTWSNTSGAPLSVSVARHQLVIDGTTADRVNFSDSWTNAGTVSDGINTYTVYDAAATAAQLLIRQGVMVNTGITPLVLDLDGNGISTTPVTNGVNFDIDANGQLERTGWTDGKDGLLALDINNDGIINNAGELFGEGTLMANNGRAADGYQALGQYDTDANGIIDSSDTIFSQLKIWQDSNLNGVTDSGELNTLAELGIVSLDLHMQAGTQIDNGNTLDLISSYTTTGGENMAMADVRFQTGIPTVIDNSSFSVSNIDTIIAPTIT